MRVTLLLRGLDVPVALNTAFDTLIRWTLLRVRRQHSIHFITSPYRNLKSVAKMNLRDLQHTVDFLDISFNICHEIFSRLDLPHIQCGSEGAEQSSGDTGNHVIKCGWILGTNDFASVLLLIEVLDTTMNAEVKWFVKSFNPCGSVRSFVLGNLDSAGVGD